MKRIATLVILAAPFAAVPPSFAADGPDASFYKKAAEAGLFEVDARVALEDLEEALGRTLVTAEMEQEDIDTAAGLVTALAGRVPQRGEVIAHPSGLEFEVTDADPRRVKRVRVRPAPTIAEPDPSSDG